MAASFSAREQLDRETLIAEVRRFLDLVLQETKLELNFEVQSKAAAPGAAENAELLVLLVGPDQDLLLERNGELLQALEYLAWRWLRLEPRLCDRVRFDSGDYRALRLEELKLSAQVAAEKVRASRQPFRFNPMPARERRVLHLALQGAAGVRTSSEGERDRRQVVVYPAETEPRS
jgi:spoIIIJ-associated protein